jgi:hypothetical protein
MTTPLLTAILIEWRWPTGRASVAPLRTFADRFAA